MKGLHGSGIKEELDSVLTVISTKHTTANNIAFKYLSAGTFQQEFRKAQYHGTPTPILWVAEYFLIDGEGFRFGRFYRTAGWYTHIALWMAFPCWIIANILFRSLIRHGAYFLIGTGCLQLLGVLLWSVIRNPNELFIPFADGNIVTKYGITYWLTFASGDIEEAAEISEFL